MKRILFILTTAILLSACANTTIEDDAAKREKLQQLKQQVHTLQQQIDSLEKELDNTEDVEVVQIKAQQLALQKFEHFIEVTAKVEADQDVDVSPETSGIIKTSHVSGSGRKGVLISPLPSINTVPPFKNNGTSEPNFAASSSNFS